MSDQSPRRDLQGLRHPRAVPRRARRRPSPAGSGTRSSRFTGAGRSRSAHDMRPSSGRWPAFADGATLAGADVVDLGLASTTSPVLRVRSPRRAGGDVHRQPQPRAVQRHQAVPGGRPPVGEDTGLAQIQAVVAEGLLERAAEPGRSSASTCFPSTSSTSTRSSTSARCARCAWSPTPPTAWAGSSSPPCSPTCRSTCPSCSRARRDVPEPSRRPDPAREPQGPPTLGARRQRRRRAGLRRRRRPRVPRRRGPSRVGIDHHRHPGQGDPRPAPGETVVHNLICSKAVPEVVREMGAGRPSPGSALVHQGR